MKYFGPNGTSHLLSNNQVTDANTSGTGGTQIAIGFRFPGSRIDGFRTFLSWLTGDAGGPNRYHTGDGGVVKYTVQRDNNGRPDGVILAETPPIIGAPGLFSSQAEAEARYPGAVWTQYGELSTGLKFRRIDLTAPLTVTPGEKLWVVLQNVSGPGYTSPDYDHSVSWESERNRHQWLRPLMDPDFDDSHEFRVLRFDSGSWFDKSSDPNYGLIGILEVAGDASYGYTGYGPPSASDTGDQSTGFRIDGVRRVRQAWTPLQDRTLTSFGLGAGLVSGSAPVTLEIKQAGTVLYSTLLPGFPQLNGQDVLALNGIGTQIVNLPDVQVSGGSPVYFELSTSPGTVYLIGAGKDGRQAGYFGGGGFIDGHAEPFDGSNWLTAMPWLEVACNWLAR